MAARIKKGDEVIVTTGKDKGRRGTVLNLLDNDRVLVEGISMVKKHQKGDPNSGVQGGIIEKESPIHISNVMPYNPATKKGDRISYRTVGEGDAARKVRAFRSNGETVDA